MSIDLTFIAQIIVFILMVRVLWKLLYAPLNDAMEARTKKIETGLAAAEAGVEAKARAEAEIAAKLAEAKAKAQEIIAAAEKRSAEIKEDALNKSRNEAEQILDNAREEVHAELERARQSLRAEVASIAMLAAERIVEAELDAKRHAKIIDAIVQEGLGAA
ncbi:F0F1 ATP synthase subunit B [Mariprofundus erugo]|uniref:ATP synthase subunit b n=1 Tax=Mariprofundus erugo TaxID=2528639 RepID=A0A5R9GW94_9PROT|nr:F0F1 ATP synthase subunit B [Mariprofundus erugo]TLS68212.1 F0F1 ATP synthase subunit B [Mariprofundus erugo]TLS77068.1 F0F1 ATP synthase subunit B [Mariprofundus erugo]